VGVVGAGAAGGGVGGGSGAGAGADVAAGALVVPVTAAVVVAAVPPEAVGGAGVAGLMLLIAHLSATCRPHEGVRNGLRPCPRTETSSDRSGRGGMVDISLRMTLRCRGAAARDVLAKGCHPTPRGWPDPPPPKPAPT
jgi:hypothetical protein